MKVTEHDISDDKKVQVSDNHAPGKPVATVVQENKIDSSIEHTFLSVDETRKLYEVLKEEYEDDEPEYIVDIRFALEGISVSVYTDGGATVHEESWFTWNEVDDLKGNEESNITFEL